jgi:mannitol-1-phosphate 5-dehydrogenase
MPIHKIVIFGAGKIGRSFIGQVFSRSGYEVVFVDIDETLVGLLNERRAYNVIIKGSDSVETLTVEGVRSILLGDGDRVVEELADASLGALCVGQKGLPAALPLLARALQLRKLRYGSWPLDLIIAENMRNADQFVSQELVQLLPDEFPLEEMAGLIETSIGKMVPIMTRKDLEEDPLQVFAEPYNSLIVARRGFRNPVPDIPFLAPKENIKAWVDRKLFIHNLGHATVAYLGFRKNPGWTYIYEALGDEEIFRATRMTMLQSADILMALYPDEFTGPQLEEHIDDLLHRFGNRALGDTIFRVGCHLYRKLGPDDRLAGPIHAALQLGKPCDKIRESLLAAIHFRAADELGNHHPEDLRFFAEAQKVPGHILQSVCRL